MYHYVYRITNICLNKHYYGVRTSKEITPALDLGIKYFSSSLDKSFRKDQKENPQNYKYKIVMTFSSRKSAAQFEIKLHNKFNVGVNELFYNRAKATSVSFSMFGINQSEETKLKIKINGTGWKHADESKRRMSISAKRKRPYMLGIPKSEEQKQKISDTKKNQKLYLWNNKRDTDRWALFFRTQEFYDIWIFNNKPKRGKLGQLLNINCNKIASFINYFIKYGNPSNDETYITWLQENALNYY